MHIDYLADHRDLIPTLAPWHHRQWAYLNPGKTLEQRIAKLRGHCGRKTIPVTFVALEDTTLLGSASLVEDDMDTYPDLSPWLASVYVAPEHRRQGIGSALVRRVVEEAAALGSKTLFLFTPDRESLYARLGWKVRSREQYRGVDVVVMELDLASGQ